MEKTHIKQLLQQYLDGEISDVDRRALEELVIGNKDPEAVIGELRTMLELMEDTHTPIPADWQDIPGAITTIDKPVIAPVRRLRLGWWAAAVVLIVAGSFYLWSKSSGPAEQPLVQQPLQDIPPGRPGAVLTLSNGKKVLLDSLKDGIVIIEGGAKARIENGTLLYDGSASPLLYNTLTTGKGRQFNVTLPDGTRAWLNSLSSIRFPVAFTGKKREISVTGEVYLEVIKDVGRPFFVNINGKAQAEVLGTSFNINAYSDEENIHTTLVDGSLKVTALDDNMANRSIQPVILSPGQEAQLSNMQDRSIAVNNDVNIEKVLAWKNGLFYFDGLSFGEIMLQLERWYDIEVVYINKVPTRRLGGKMTMNTPLGGILKYFKQLGIEYTLEGKKLIIK